VIWAEEVCVCVVQENRCPQDLIGNDEGHGHDGAGLELGSHWILSGVEPIDEQGLFFEDGLVGDRRLGSSQAGSAELGCHPAICLRSDQLIGGNQLPHVGSAYLEVLAGFLAESLQDLCRRGRLGSSG